MKTVLFIDTAHSFLYKKLSKNCKVIEGYNLSEKEIIDILPNINGIIIRSRIQITKKIIDIATKLEIIARIGAGMENIDCDYAKEKGIVCINSPEGNRQAVGEHALSLLLCGYNKISKSNIEVKNNIWQREENRGIELSKKTVGIIGYGNTGKAFAKVLSGFDCKVLAYDIIPNKYDYHCKISTPEEIKKKANIISFHLPETKDTFHYFDKKFLKSCKKNVSIINTCRGKVINSKALLNGLESGKINFAGLDVLEYEKKDFYGIKDDENIASQIINHPNVLITPHIAGWTEQSHLKMAKITYKKMNKIWNLKNT